MNWENTQIYQSENCQQKRFKIQKRRESRKKKQQYSVIWYCFCEKDGHGLYRAMSKSVKLNYYVYYHDSTNPILELFRSLIHHFFHVSWAMLIIIESQKSSPDLWLKRQTISIHRLWFKICAPLTIYKWSKIESSIDLCMAKDKWRNDIRSIMGYWHR